MNRRLLCMSVAAIISVSIGFAAAVSLQDVSNFPELYVGSPIEIDQVNLEGKMKKDMGFYCLGVEAQGFMKEKKTGDKEGYAGRFLNMERVTFVADADMAKKLLGEMEETNTYPVKIRFTVERIEEVGNVYWIARVSRVHFLGPGGAIAKTVSTEAVAGPDRKAKNGAKK